MSDRGAAVQTAHRAGLVGCRCCGRVRPQGTAACDRCGGALRPPDRRGLGAVWSWLAAGIIFYIPALLLPMLGTRAFPSLRWSEATIVGGAIDLMRHGSHAIGLVILTVSVVFPLGKFAIISWLAAVAGRPATVAGAHRRLRAYEIVEWIGRWSMIDIFVVAILSALVQFGLLASVRPGPAVLVFALSVVCTMRAAQSFDPRLIWRALPSGRRNPAA